MNHADDRGRLLVPFDLRADVIEPLRRLGDKLDRLSEQVQEHVARHDESTREAIRAYFAERWARRREFAVRYGRLIAAAVGGLISLVAMLWTLR